MSVRNAEQYYTDSLNDSGEVDTHPLTVAQCSSRIDVPGRYLTVS